MTAILPAALRRPWHRWIAKRHRTGANAGNAAEQYNLAWELEEAGDLIAAERWYRSAVAQGDTDAMTNLARLLYERDSATHRKEAMNLWAVAADSGDGEAAYNAGDACEDIGDHVGMLTWMQRAAELGDRDAKRRLPP